ncbi:MAG: DUF2213 domain-containing protein [Methanobrevibacter sp.]|nr:DUF2213 domain-containing protein [Methanobrevibacter sp.]
MIKLFSNAKEENKVYYCKHIAPGVCAYKDETIFIGEDTLKEMDRSFSGKPIFINHQTVNPDTEKEEAIGYVVESFYLPEDGTHWAKLLIIDDKGHEAIKQGWKVSNAYQPTGFGVGGEWHNVPYNREVTNAHYTHLALVENPRYEEAEIMTAEDFKKYKEAKKSQLEQLQNSKAETSKQGENKMSWKLFTKKEVTNSDDISKVMVELSDGSAVSIGEMVNSVEKDLKEKEDKENGCHNEDVMDKVVKVNGEDMKVSDLVAAFEKKDCNNADEEEKAEDEEKKDKKNKKAKKNEADEEDKKGEEKEDKKNADDVDKRKLIDEVGGFLKDKGLTDEDIRFVMKKMEKDAYEKDEAGKNNEDEEGKDKKADEKKDKKNSKDLLEAEEKANAKEFVGVVADTMARKLARGAERYGSAK